MNKSCESCKKADSCKRVTGLMYGFCNAGYEPRVAVSMALVKLYDHLNRSIDLIQSDLEDNTLTENTGRSGQRYFWYIDENNDACISIDTLEIIDDERIEEELL